MARRPDDPEAARFRALRLLERRPQSVAEMRRKLRDRGFTPETVRKVIARLSETGLLDDEKFARNFAQMSASMKPQGRRLLAMKLAAHGVARELAEAAAAEALEGRDEADLAGESARRWAKRLHGRPLDQRARKRLEGHLARRGFGWNAIAKALRGLGVDEDSG